MTRRSISSQLPSKHYRSNRYSRRKRQHSMKVMVWMMAACIVLGIFSSTTTLLPVVSCQETKTTTTTEEEDKRSGWGSRRGNGGTGTVNSDGDSGGDAAAPDDAATAKKTSTMAKTAEKAAAAAAEKVAEAEENQNNKIPFVAGGSAKQQQAGGAAGSNTVPPINTNLPLYYEPPEGFRITARVYTDPKDKLAHFDHDTANFVFPYWECGVSGSTTVPIPLQHATIRHLLGGSQPNQYSGEEFGPYPQLVVAMTPLEIVLNSGQSHSFQSGDVVLLEDVVSGGHKLKGVTTTAANGSGSSTPNTSQHQDMTVMILTLSHHYHQVGKDNSSLRHILKQTILKKNPCRTGLEATTPNTVPRFNKHGMLVSMHNKDNPWWSGISLLQPHNLRRYMLTILGLSISTLAGDFLGKVAPLWLAVAFGGGCFVTGGTYAVVKVGDSAIDRYEVWQEKRQLQLASSAHNDDEEKEAFMKTETLKNEERDTKPGGPRVKVPDDSSKFRDDL